MQLQPTYRRYYCGQEHFYAPEENIFIPEETIKETDKVQTYKDLWGTIIEKCKEHLSVVAYETWIKHMIPLSFDGVVFCVKVPTEMYRDVINQNYINVINHIFSDTIGIEPEIRIMTAEEYDAEEGIQTERQVDILSTYTFSNYIIGSTNNFAFAASHSVAEKFPTITYNPLVLYGQSGVGKTHLALAIFNYIKQKYPEKNLIYMRSEEFTNDVITGIHEGNMAEIRNRFRSVDVLLLDDIHFIAGKDSVQEEFFNTFNALYQNNKQIIVTCDRPISEVKTLEDRICSRLSAGLSCDIQLPDYETRVGILKANAKACGLEIKDDIIYFIAEQIKNNVRQLEGVIKKLSAISQFDKGEINRTVAVNVIRDIRIGQQPEPITVEKIVEEVSRTYSVSPDDIMSDKRTASIAMCRHISIYIAREITHLSLEQIGSYFNKDHATVHYSISKVEKLMSNNIREKETIGDIIKNLRPQ